MAGRDSIFFPFPSRAAPCHWTAGGLLFALGGCVDTAVSTPASIDGGLLMTLAAGALLNAGALGAVLLIWGLLGRKRRQRDWLRRELRYLRHWSDESGVMRKAGMIRDLNQLGSQPEDLEHCQLAGADLKGARLQRCQLRAAHLQEADLQGADLQGADLFGADLTGANLSLANLRGANLRGASLEGAVLVKAELEGVNLHRANLAGADLNGTNLNGARLDLARFAAREEGIFLQTMHPSVEDWIRERLDSRGRYREGGEGDERPESLPDAV